METKDKSKLTRLKNKEREINYKIKQLIMEEQYVAQTDSFQTVERALTTAEEKKVSLLFEQLHAVEDEIAKLSAIEPKKL